MNLKQTTKCLKQTTKCKLLFTRVFTILDGPSWTTSGDQKPRNFRSFALPCLAEIIRRTLLKYTGVCPGSCAAVYLVIPIAGTAVWHRIESTVLAQTVLLLVT